jgi:predicted DNA-binding transcriptional regulator AlpA
MNRILLGAHMAAEIRPSDDEWMSVEQFAKIAGKAVRSIYNDIQRGDDLPPYYRFKQFIRFRKSEVDAWTLKFRRVSATAQLQQQQHA